MTHNPYFYIAVMALVSYTTRVLPLTLIRKPIKNQFIQSFLYSVPYITLSVMTFPAIIEAMGLCLTMHVNLGMSLRKT